MKKAFGVFLFFWAVVLVAFSQEPTFTTTRLWRPTPTAEDPNAGHFVYFYDRSNFDQTQSWGKTLNVKALPPAPATFDFGVGVDYPMLLNDQLGCCFYSSICHHDQTLTYNATGKESQFNLTVFRQRYLALSGGDNGLGDQDVQQEWRNRGLADVPQARIVDWLYVDTTTPGAIAPAMYWFGGTQFTFVVPQAWISNSGTGAIWDASTYRPNNNGHAVHWCGVDAKGNYKLVTWGTYVWITPAGVRVCDPSGFVVFSTRWFNDKGYAPNGKHITELATMWVAAGGKTIPATVISAFPPPGDGPSPPPPPPPPSGLPTITLDKPLPAGKYQIAPLGKLIVEPADVQALKDSLDRLLGGKASGKSASRVEELEKRLAEQERHLRSTLDLLESMQKIIGSPDKKNPFREKP